MQPRAILKRNGILDTAAFLFAEHGYRGTNMKLLAQEAQASTSTIYGYFDDKTDLLHQSIERRLEALEADLLERIADVDDPIQALLQGVVVLNESVAADPLLSKLLVYESRVADVQISRHAWRVLQRIDKHAISLVNRATRDGAMACDDPEALITTLRLALQGWLLNRARGQHQISQDRLTRLVRHLILGLVNDV